MIDAGVLPFSHFIHESHIVESTELGLGNLGLLDLSVAANCCLPFVRSSFT